MYVQDPKVFFTKALMKQKEKSNNNSVVEHIFACRRSQTQSLAVAAKGSPGESAGKGLNLNPWRATANHNRQQRTGCIKGLTLYKVYDDLKMQRLHTNEIMQSK